MLDYGIRDKVGGQIVERGHVGARAAQRACMILNCHELKNGRSSARYVIEPEIVEACPPTFDELDLPDWAIEALNNA